MLMKLQGDVKPDATGPEVFAAVVNIHQQLSSSGVRTLTKKLLALKLAKEPGENVETFAAKVLEIAKRIKGTRPENCPKDLVVLAYEPFLGSSMPTFNMEVIAMYNKATKRDKSVDNFEAHITEFKNQWRDLEICDMWEAKKHHKEKSRGPGNASANQDAAKDDHRPVQQEGREGNGRQQQSGLGRPRMLPLQQERAHQAQLPRQGQAKSHKGRCAAEHWRCNTHDEWIRSQESSGRGQASHHHREAKRTSGVVPANGGQRVRKHI
jgi:hypothetical protein